MTHPLTHRATRLAVATAAGLALSAAPALATEPGPPPTGAPLPNTLAPVSFAPNGPPAPGARAVRPRVTGARLTPRRVVRGHRSQLRLSLASAARVRVVLERTVRGKRVRVSARTVAAKGGTLSMRLSTRLRTGRYRVSVVAIDAQGNQSRAVRRSLTVVRRAR